MRVTVSFVDLLHRTVNTLIHHRHLLWFTLPFGLFAAISLELSESLPSLNTTPPIDGSDFLMTLRQNSSLFFWTFGGIFLSGIFRSLLRGPFFLAFEKSMTTPGESTDHHPSTLRTKTHLQASLTSLIFEGMYWAMVILLVIIVSLPILLALRFNQGVVPTITELALLLILIIGTLFFFLKEFALLYALLAHTKIKLSLELSLRLFKKHVLLTLLFGLFIIVLSLLFTFPANLAIIASDFISPTWLQVGFRWISLSSIFGISILLEEGLRLAFFHALAATPQIKIPGIEAILQKKKDATSSTPLA